MKNRTALTRAALVAGALVLGLALPKPADATWSIIAVDQETGQVVIASATCVSQEALLRFPSSGLKDIQAIVVPGVGVAAAQASVDNTRENQRLIHRELKAGTPPDRILAMLSEDPRFAHRQFGIVDLQGRTAAHTGAENLDVALARTGELEGAGVFFSIQGNILASEEVVSRAEAAFRATEGSLADRVMAAMEAADAAGGDRRCTSETEPVPDAPCEHRTAHVAYIVVADPADPEGESFNDGDWALFVDVTDQNITPGENANPVTTLRKRYDAVR